jgi:predicted phosphodiesterase
MSEVRGLSLGRHGEQEWEHFSAGYRLSPDKGIAAVFADSSEVRGEVRRRLESLAPQLVRFEPGGDLLARVQELAAGTTRPAIAWIEAQQGGEAESAWQQGLLALNRGRDRFADHGPVFIVIAGPIRLNELMRARAPDLSSVVGPALLLGDTLEPIVEPKSPLCWLHLSDLHVQSANWEQDVVLSALLRDLPGLLEQAQRKPQLLFVTGDVANRGTAVEYDGAFRLLDQLCRMLNLEPERHVFMVPGNHDVDRAMISPSAERFARGFDDLGEDEFRTAIGQLIDAPADLEIFGRRLTAWCNFTNRFLGPARQVSIDRPWRSDLVEVGGIRVGIASICSVWMSGPQDAKDRLIVGERQVRLLVDELAATSADLRIALIHHPTSWLREAEERRIQRLLRDEVDVLLHGHVHDPNAGAFVHGQRNTIEIGAGATYAGSGQDRFHGFTVAQVDPGRGQLELDAFTWTTRSGIWHIDAGFHADAPKGRLCLPMQLVRFGQGATQAVAPELTVRLRRAVVGVHGSQGFVGLPDAAPKPQATLHDMFVPLELSTRESETQRRPLVELTDVWLRRRAEGELAPRVVVLGDPGSGKSTLCRYLAVTAAEGERGLVPLLLTVRDWSAKGTCEGLLEQARRYATDVLQVSTGADTLERLCKMGEVVLLIDGVDEIGPSERETLRDRVHGFAAAYPRSPIVATSRIVGYDEAPLDHRRFEHFSLEPFDDEQLRDFIQRWYAVAEPDNPVERQRRQAELWAALQVEPRALQLARNPLLATLLGLVHFHRAQLPGDRAELYKLCVETLVVTWPAACRRGLPELPGHRQLPLLEDLALWMQSQRPDEAKRGDGRGIVITGEQLESRLLTLIELAFQDFDEGRRRDLAHKWRIWLLRASGLIQEQQNDRFGFLHLSLMEYLAGQAAWRKQGRAGHSEIASFVVAQHRKVAWRETLLLMLGSHADERALGNLVAERLLAIEPRSWATSMFMLGMLREEIDLDADLRTLILDAVAEAALSQLPPSWSIAQAHMADILRFGRRHGQALRQWIRSAMAVRSGQALVGGLVVLPEDVEPTPDLCARSDEELGIETLLDLGVTPWGRWAADRAQASTWLRWADETPLEGIFLRSLASAVVPRETTSAIWVGALLRRMSWVGGVITKAAGALRGVVGVGGHDVPVHVKWTGKFGDVEVCVAPSVLVASEDDQHESSEYFTSNFAGHLARDSVAHIGFLSAFTGIVPAYIRIFITKIITGDITDIWRSLRDMAGGVLSGDLTRDLTRSLVLPRGANLHLRHAPAHTSNEIPLGLSGLSRRYTEEFIAQRILIPLAADAHAGRILAASAQSTAHLATARAQNRWLHTVFDHLVIDATHGAPLTPEQHALFLALGLAQFQTTWSWPPGPHWHSWFTSSPPEYWLAAYVWYLCWAVGEPEDTAHQANAAACLDRGDWPELVAELRSYKVGMPSDEVLAIFSNGPPP